MYRFIKAFFDRIFSLILFIILLPIFLLVFIMLYIHFGGNPFFVQQRPGYNARTIRILKFKTMNDKKDSNGELLPDKDRLTALGKFIRKTSLDEIPQLINVIKGDMSIVGPRPLLMQYLPLYNDFQKRRHEVQPGITGWAQIQGRNNIDWQKRFELDVYYVDHQSFFFDLKILLMTAVKIFKTSDVSQEGHVTVENFKGNE